MAGSSSAATFDREPLHFLDRATGEPGDAFWLPDRQLCLAEIGAAKAVLANENRLYQEHSDFFHTRRGPFGPRTSQVEIGRGARRLLRLHLEERAGELEASISRELLPASEWPDAGNRLIYYHLRAALAAPESPQSLRRTIDEVVERAVLAGARERHSWFQRALFRRRALRELSRCLDQRRRRDDAPPRDLLDVMVDSTGAEVPAEVLAELYLGFIFAIAGSVGFTLGWSIYLLGTHRPSEAEPAWVVREALRLWPVAWLMARRPARPHEIAGVAVTPHDEVLVCPYLLHRHPRYWEDPLEFRPDRWRQPRDEHAFIPFGWGPHTCVAASLTFELVEQVLSLLAGGYRLAVAPHTTQPFVGPALAPPRFTLRLLPRRP
ncbi:MAG TPA: cytochrome P450 [Thermoanaerobaculia bacterium]|nr:cytochrome P450 [Thermoanaerobaculia bacterium]